MNSTPKAKINEDIPNPETNLLKTPLYQRYTINDDNYNEVLRLEFYSKTIDCFCQKCNKESTFQRTNLIQPLIFSSGELHNFDIFSAIEEKQEIPDLFYNYTDKRPPFKKPVKAYAFEERCFTIEFECARCISQRILFIYKIEKSKLIKIGQYPSISDLEKYTIRKYEKLLGKEKAKEFNVAIRLFANGLGIASFVYLRRIFEYVIDKYHEEAKKASDWDEDKYCKSRVEEKIFLLKNYLPSFVIENRKIYPILSKGIHELTEEVCLTYFDPLKIIIELILDQIIAQKEKSEKEKKGKDTLGKIFGELKT